MAISRVILIFTWMALVPSLLVPEGPQFHHKDATVQKEFDNTYQDIRNAKRNIYVGAGTPEAVVTAPIGSLYLNSSGGANTTLYVKESGTGNTGWAAK